MIHVNIEDGKTGYSEVYGYVEKYWNHNIKEDTIISLALSYNGLDWRYCNEVVSPCDSGVELLYDWWEDEEYIRILGIKSLNQIRITGGIYDE